MSRLVAAVRRGRGSDDRLSDHALRERRLDAVRDAVEQFIYDLGLLIAGHDPPEGAGGSVLTHHLRHELQPFLGAGDVMRPDFGAFGDLRVEGSLLEATVPVLAILEFDDRCARETAEGRVVPARGRRLRMTLHVELEPTRVTECAFADVTDRRG
jgi:hypothetical protein